MPDSFDKLILYPAFAMFALVAFVFVRLARLRIGAVGRGDVDVRFYKAYQEGEEPEHVRVVTRHFINLFEVPMLFYGVVLMTYVTHQTNASIVFLAWVYVASRYVHSYVHLGPNDVRTRIRVFAASGVVLAILWISLFVRLLASG